MRVVGAALVELFVQFGNAFLCEGIFSDAENQRDRWFQKVGSYKAQKPPEFLRARHDQAMPVDRTRRLAGKLPING